MELHLRPLVVDDAATLTAWGDDAVFRAHAGWGKTGTELQSWWQESIRTPGPELLRLAVTHRTALVGFIDLHGWDADARELGFLIGPSTRWGQGLGAAAAAAGVEHGFRALGLNAIWAEALEANHASVRVLQRIGMHRTGVGDTADFLGEPSRYVRFETTRDRWHAKPEREHGAP